MAERMTTAGEAPMDDVGEAERRRLRKLWRDHFAVHEKVAAEWRARDYQSPPPVFPPFPDKLRDLTCGAKTRAGTPCKRKDLYTNARCPLHGGLSTGPTTPEGKANAAKNGRKPKRKKRTP
jgi:hypothetical protein